MFLLKSLSLSVISNLVQKFSSKFIFSPSIKLSKSGKSLVLGGTSVLDHIQLHDFVFSLLVGLVPFGIDCLIKFSFPGVLGFSLPLHLDLLLISHVLGILLEYHSIGSSFGGLVVDVVGGQVFVDAIQTNQVGVGGLESVAAFSLGRKSLISLLSLLGQLLGGSPLGLSASVGALRNVLSFSSPVNFIVSKCHLP